MVYEKKVEPLTRYEATMVGVTLIIWMIILILLPVISLSEWYIDIFKFNSNNKDEMQQFHEMVQSNKWELLSSSVVILIGYPIILSHMHYMKRFFDTFGSFTNLSLIVSLYNNSWFIIAIVYCIIQPTLLIFIAYYEWDFDQEFAYIGHVMQFQFSVLSNLLWDAVIVPMGITACLPWFALLLGILGYNKSSYWELQTITQQFGVRATTCYATCCNLSKCSRIMVGLVLIVMILITLFGSYGNAFDFEPHGFFSYHGESQWLFCLLFISWFIISIVYIYTGCHLDSLQAVMNTSVKSIPLSYKDNQYKDNNNNNNNNNDQVSTRNVDDLQITQITQKGQSRIDAGVGGVEN